MDKDKMIEDIVAMLDGSVKKGDGHINERRKVSYKRKCWKFNKSNALLHANNRITWWR